MADGINSTELDSGRLTNGRPGGSFILALHTRLEQVWQDHAKIDGAQPPQPEVKPGLLPATDPDFVQQMTEYHRCAEGMEQMEKEADLLRLALLYQVPDDDRDLALLLHHVQETFGHGDNLGDRDKEALNVALNSCFDYLMSEGRADMDAFGRGFRNATMWAFHRRRYRTGVVEGEA